MKSETFALLVVLFVQNLEALTAHDTVNCEVSQLGSKVHESPFRLFSFLFKWMNDQQGRLALP